MSGTPEVNIDVIQITDYLTYFYWGRHPQDPMMDMRLGGGSFALHQGDTALVIDTMARSGQGVWVRRFLEDTYGIQHFTLISSHWHVDHIIDNQAYENDIIIGHKLTRTEMLNQKATFEAGRYSDYEPFRVVPPNLVFEGTLELWLKDLQIELQEYLVHEKGHLGVYLPDDKIFIANDILEDPVWFFDFDFAPPEIQIAELERLLSLDVDKIFPCHGSVEIITNGGYSKQLIQDNLDYLKAMLAEQDRPDFMTKTGPDFIEPALRRGSLTWWEPYAEVHDLNKAAVLNL